MVQELLQEFYRNTKKRPERIIVYRDGVSEGQFDAVVREELPQVSLLCCCSMSAAVTRTTCNRVCNGVSFCLYVLAWYSDGYVRLLFCLCMCVCSYGVQCPEADRSPSACSCDSFTRVDYLHPAGLCSFDIQWVPQAGSSHFGYICAFQ